MKSRMLILLAAAALTGCKAEPPPIVAVSGIVTLDGKPLPKAEVRFYPEQPGLPGDYIAIAVTDENGKYTLMTNNQNGACACTNKVTVSEGPPPDDARSQSKFDAYKATLKNRPIPEKFGTLASSPLTITVKADQSDYPITISRR